MNPTAQKLNPKRTIAPHRVTRPEQVEQLAADMMAKGWQGEALVGYKLGAGVQLLSGTHRRAAAIIAQIAIPVVVWPYVMVELCWGKDEWKYLMASGKA